MEVDPTIRTPRSENAREIDYQKYLQGPSWRVTRNHALRLAGYRCFRCGTNRSLQVHHKTYERLGREWDQDLEVVCEPCHNGIHVDEMRQDDRGRIYLRLATEALRTERFLASVSELSDAVKTRCAKLKIPYDGHQVDRALALLIGRWVPAEGPRQKRRERPQFQPLSRSEAAAIWQHLLDEGLPLDKLGRP